MRANEIEDQALLEEAQLTAFALGELEGAEKDAVANRIAKDAGARELVQATRATAQQLEGELKKELSDAAAAMVPAARREAVAMSERPSRRPRLFWLFGAGALAAAMLVVCVTVIMSAVRPSATPADASGQQKALGASPDGPRDPDAGNVAEKPDRKPDASVKKSESPITAPRPDEEASSFQLPNPVFMGTPQASPAGVKSDPKPFPERIPDMEARRRYERPIPVIPPQLEPQVPLPIEQPNPVKPDTEDYQHIVDNEFKRVSAHPLSTFSIDVDTGAYSIIRRFLQLNHRLPPADAVRIEEMINYFDYGYEAPTDDKPFATHVEIAPCPWKPEHRLAKIGLKGREITHKGNGTYGYIDTLNEAKKLIVDQMSGTLVTIAKDVEIQIEFNPAVVGAYRLIGYENRLLNKEDFNDDTQDAVEIGAGHTVTALYEIVPVGQPVPLPPGVDPLKYQKKGEPTEAAQSGEMMTLKLRYREPKGQKSKLLEFPITDQGLTQAKSTEDFRFAAAVASFGMILRNSPYKGVSTPEFVLEMATEGKGVDRNGYRAEFIELVKKAMPLVKQRDARK